MTKGGSRPGAGRKRRFTFMKKLALANEVILRMQEQNLSATKALDQLREEGLISPQSRARYITPAYLEQEFCSLLKEMPPQSLRSLLEQTPREGILQLLPRLSKDSKL